MRFVIQVVEEAQVRVTQEADGSVPENGSYVSGSIGRGLMVLVGIGEDTPAIADRMVEKMRKLRIFEDENGKTNLDLAAVGGEVLLVSQFTLYADCRKGNRPSFTGAAEPSKAQALYQHFCQLAQRDVPHVGRGVFGAMMRVSLANDGPFTIWRDTDELTMPHHAPRDSGT